MFFPIDQKTLEKIVGSPSLQSNNNGHNIISKVCTRSQAAIVLLMTYLNLLTALISIQYLIKVLFVAYLRATQAPLFFAVPAQSSKFQVRRVA
jgi:hypothetical protein